MSSLFFIGCVLFVATVLVHFAFTHIRSSHYVRNGYLVAIVVGAASLPVLASLRPWALGFVYLQFIILWNLYLIFFINLMNSVSLRMMGEILASPTRSLSLDQLSQVYSDDEALESRLHALARNGFILDRSEQGFTLTPRGALLARVLAASRWCFGIERFG